MTSPDFLAISGAALVGLGFLAGRWSEKAFVLVGISTVAAAAASTYVLCPRPLDAVLVTGGLFLLFFGCGIVRVMLHRSASLRMLDRIAEGSRETTAREDIARRLGDLEKYRLARPETGGYRLTPFGRLVAFWVGLLYGATRIRT